MARIQPDFFRGSALRFIFAGFHEVEGDFKASNESLGGGFKYFLCSPLFGEDSHFD